jgi:glucose/arabinose dehydrogenase
MSSAVSADENVDFMGGVADFAPFPGLDAIDLPDGFSIEVYADGVEGARSMCLGDSGTVFVGTRGQGVVYALTDYVTARTATVRVVASDLDSPNGVAFHDGALYVAEIGRVLRFDDIEERLDDPPPAVVVSDSFPKDRHHGWKFIAFGPDGMLYVPVGAPCNVCESADERHATIMRMRPDGSDLEIYARGVRNTVGFDWYSRTGELWFTDNGRDWLGDDRPPCGRACNAGRCSPRLRRQSPHDLSDIVCPGRVAWRAVNRRAAVRRGKPGRFR